MQSAEAAGDVGQSLLKTDEARILTLPALRQAPGHPHCVNCFGIALSGDGDDVALLLSVGDILGGAARHQFGRQR